MLRNNQEVVARVLTNNPETSKQVIDKLMIPFPESEMSFHAISTDAGNSRKNRNVPDIKNEVSNNSNLLI